MQSTFISYSREDSEFVAKLQTSLETNMAVWRDIENLRRGDRWPRRLGEAIAASQSFTLIWSANAQQSHFVDLEWNIAVALKRLIWIVRRDTSDLPPTLLPIESRYFPEPEEASRWLLDLPCRKVPAVSPASKSRVLQKLSWVADDDTPSYIKETLTRNVVITGNIRNINFYQQSEKSEKEIRKAVVPGSTPKPSPLTPWNIRKLRPNLAPNVAMVGRSEELNLLKTAWGRPKGCIVSIEGPAGAGKTALVREFLKHLRQSNEAAPPDAVYGWTFHNQGQQDFQSTAIGFVRDALKHFGLPHDIRPFTELAQVLRGRRCVLILDGIETLQTTQSEGGLLLEHANEEGFRTFLQEVCDNDLPKGGLVLITSKERVKEVDPNAGNTEVIELKELLPEEGAALFSKLGVRGPQEELQDASVELRGNPLFLVVLGGYLKHNSLPIIERQKFKFPTEGENAEWLNRATAAYAGRLQKEERSFLRLLGLFGRPMRDEDLVALKNGKSAEAVKFLSKHSQEALKSLIRQIFDQHLLNIRDRQGILEEWDTHPLLRKHFAEEFRSRYSRQWREAHGKLFEHYSLYKKTNPAESDGTLALFGAVGHGCLATRYTEAYELYRSRIAREFDGNDTERTAFAPDAFYALARFFTDADYCVPEPRLDHYAQAWLLARISYCLHTLGEMKKAIRPRVSSNEIYRTLGRSDYAKVRYEAARDAAYGAEVLSQIQLRLGLLAVAGTTAQEGIKLAGDSEANEGEAKQDPIWRRDYPIAPVPSWLRLCSTESAYGTVLHKQGKLQEADRYFRRAVERHSEKCSEDREYTHCPIAAESVFHSEPGVWWALFRCDQAEAQEELNELLAIAKRMQRWSDGAASRSTDPIRGLHDLVHGIILTELADVQRNPKTGRRPKQLMEQALEDLEKAYRSVKDSKKYLFECDVLLARARTLRYLSRFDAALADAKSALGTAEQYGMRLTQVDAWILKGHLVLDKQHASGLEEATEGAKKGRKLISETEYFAADPGLCLLEARLEFCKKSRANKVPIKLALEKARVSLEKYPVMRLNRQLDRYARGEWKS